MTHKTRLFHWLMEMRMMGKDKTPVLVLPPSLYQPGIVVSPERYCPAEAAFLIVPGAVHYFSYLGKNLADLAGAAEKAGGRFDLALVSQLAEFRAMNESRNRVAESFCESRLKGGPRSVVELAYLVGAAKIVIEIYEEDMRTRIGLTAAVDVQALENLKQAVSPFLEDRDDDLVGGGEPAVKTPWEPMTVDVINPPADRRELARLRRIELAAMAFTTDQYRYALHQKSIADSDRLKKAIAGWES